MSAFDKLEDHPVRSVFIVGISIILLAADYMAGPFIQFPVTYLIPISLAAWFNNRALALSLAVALPVLRLVFVVAMWTVPWTPVEATINCIIRISVFSIFAVLIDRTAKQTRQLSKEVNMLSGLLPICAFCKKIRDDRDEWQPIESYISSRSEADFSHGFCPECVEKHYGPMLKKESSI